jgi:hypothetical protein
LRTIYPSAARDATIVLDVRGESIKSLIIVLPKVMAYDTGRGVSEHYERD